MERLTEPMIVPSTGEIFCYRLKPGVSEWKLKNKLGAYETAEEQGLLLRLPCKVGDEFWIIAYRDKKMVHVRCTGYTIQVDSINKVNHAYVWLDSVDKPSDYWKMPFEEFKHQCFFNYDEAEKALAEMG